MTETLGQQIIIQRANSPLISEVDYEVRNGKFLTTAIDAVYDQRDRVFPNGTGGFELEVGLFFEDGEDLVRVDKETRNQIIEELNILAEEMGGFCSCQYELGAHQVEVNQSPDFLLKGNWQISDVLEFHQKVDYILSTVCKKHGIRVMSLGADAMSRMDDTPRSGKPGDKYEKVPNYATKNSVGLPLMREMHLDHEPDGTMPGGIYATQFNVAVESWDKAIKMADLATMTCPYVLAMVGNSRIINGIDTGWNETRSEMWSRTHELPMGRRSFIPEKYFGSIEGYLEHISKFPLILEADSFQSAMAIAVGMTWTPGKIKPELNENLEVEGLLFEFRAVPAQLTPVENTAATLFAYGRTLWGLQEDEPLIEMDKTEKNKEAAIRQGLNAEAYYIHSQDSSRHTGWRVERADGQEMIQIELERAIKGLVTAGHGTEDNLRLLFNGCFGVEGGRLSPSQRIVRGIKQEMTGDKDTEFGDERITTRIKAKTYLAVVDRLMEKGRLKGLTKVLTS